MTMVVYHLVPLEEMELHEATSDCLCRPILIGKDDDKAWLTVIIGDQLYRHPYFSPLEQGPCQNVITVGEEREGEPAWA